MTDLSKYPQAVAARWSSGNSTLATSGGVFLEGERWGDWEGWLAVATLKEQELYLFAFDRDGVLQSGISVPELNGAYGRLRALLDLMLPGHDGVELMGDILAVSRIPVIFLSVYGKDEVVASVLEEGATDYIVKPFSPTELVARVRAALRRLGGPQPPESAEPFVLGDLTIDFVQRRVTISENTVELTPTEFDLLAELAAEAGRVVPLDRLLRRVWSPGKPGNLRVLRTHLMRPRRKLGEDAANPKYIFAEPRVGYRMPAVETEGLK